jgi:hypothetical protein
MEVLSHDANTTTPDDRFAVTAQHLAEWQSSAGVAVNKALQSPDGRFSVSVVVKGLQVVYSIEDRVARTVDDSIVVPDLVERLQWGGNSRTIVSVLHMAEGTFIERLHFANNRWVSQTYQAPASGLEHWMVLKLGIEQGAVTVTWGATRLVRRLGHKERELYLITSSIAPNGTQTLLREVPIDRETFVRLRRGFYEEPDDLPSNK